MARQEKAVACALDTVVKHLLRNSCPGKVIFCCFSETSLGHTTSP